jgi:hypothetical protein
MRKLFYILIVILTTNCGSQKSILGPKGFSFDMSEPKNDTQIKLMLDTLEKELSIEKAVNYLLPGEYRTQSSYIDYILLLKEDNSFEAFKVRPSKIDWGTSSKKWKSGGWSIDGYILVLEIDKTSSQYYFIFKWMDRVFILPYIKTNAFLEGAKKVNKAISPDERIIHLQHLLENYLYRIPISN